MDHLPITLAIYILPYLIAISRKHPHEEALMAFNLFLGWTLVGWWFALIWALIVPTPTTPAATAPKGAANV